MVPFLQDLGVMTQDGKIVRTKMDKFRQINRFLEFVEDILPQLDKDRELTYGLRMWKIISYICNVLLFTRVKRI